MKEDVLHSGLWAFVIALAAAALLCVGCASDNSRTPFHSVIWLDRSATNTALASENAGTNVISSSDWQTNKLQGVGGAGLGTGGGTITGSSTTARTTTASLSGTTTTLSPAPTGLSSTNRLYLSTTLPSPSSLSPGATNLPTTITPAGTFPRTNSFGAPQ